MGHEIHLVDVFAERKYSGNQLAVVLDAADLDTAGMLQIARETNFSETTFVTSARGNDGDWAVRIFTPGQELPFAGHPTLGTAHIIRTQLQQRAGDRVTLALGVGSVTVRVAADGRYWLTAPPIEVGATFPAADGAAALSLAPADIATDWPVQWLDSGAGYIMVPLTNAAALRRATPDVAAFERAFPGKRVDIYAISPAAEAGADLEVRLFFDANGIREDPATGSAAACLGAYLLEHAWLGPGPVDCVLAQGGDIGRPSRLYLRAGDSDEGRIIEVGGRVLDVARGELL